MRPLFNWNPRSREGPSSSPAGRITETLSASRALPKFLASLASQPAPVLLDLGPVVGANVSFFGDRLGCKMLIEDLHDDIDASLRAGSVDTLGEALTSRLQAVAAEPVNGVLCWDIFDYLDRRTARTLGSALGRLLAPKGVLHAFFGTTSGDLHGRTKYIVQSDVAMKCRYEPAPPIRRQALPSGEIGRLFPGLAIAESVLLQNNTHEWLFRKS